MSVDKLNSIIRYFAYTYPHSSELSSARITKMVYLADWGSAYWYGHQMTSIDWIFNHYGPYVDDVQETAQADPDLEVVSTENAMGSYKTLIKQGAPRSTTFLTDLEQGILNHVTRKTQNLFFNEFIKLVYATYPVKVTPKYAHFELVEIAGRYRVQAYVDPFLSP